LDDASANPIETTIPEFNPTFTPIVVDAKATIPIDFDIPSLELSPPKQLKNPAEPSTPSPHETMDSLTKDVARLTKQNQKYIDLNKCRTSRILMRLSLPHMIYCSQIFQIWRISIKNLKPRSSHLAQNQR